MLNAVKREYDEMPGLALTVSGNIADLYGDKLKDKAKVLEIADWSLKTYDTLLSKRGYAVAPVIKGVCQGCHMALPPQLNNILARMESIETCPRCVRLVYRKELLDPVVAPVAVEEPKA